MIREAKAEEIVRLVPLGKLFMLETEQLDFRPEVFVPNLEKILASGAGTVLVQTEETRDGAHVPPFEEGETIIGALGWLEFPDLWSGERTAQELFWFVDPGRRGRGMWLLKKFEKMAREHGCRRVIMTCLEDSMARDLNIFYLAFGYQPLERNYVKGV